MRKLCECGCGKPTNIATFTDPRSQTPKGQSYRFVHGHGGRRGMPKKDRVGQRCGRLVVTKLAGRREFGTQGRAVILWECRCDCDNTCIVAASKLSSQKSCGCLKNASGPEGSNYKHGYARRPEYHAWSAARDRCTNPKNDSYQDYGGRGIQFLYTSFDQFLADVGDKPTPQHSLDRREYNGNYEPGNCWWATRSHQAKNKRPAFAIENFADDQLLAEIRRRSLVLDTAVVS